MALKRRGVKYVEMRSLDLDLFNPIGIDEEKSRFIEALLLTCLLQDSPPMTETDFQTNNLNQLQVANNGRKPGLELERNQKNITLQEWALEILDPIQSVCEILDADKHDKPYVRALMSQREAVLNPDLTPSAHMLECMRQGNQTFNDFALAKSAEHAACFTGKRADAEFVRQFNQLAQQSLAKQSEMENKAQLPFDEFLTRYFAQQLP
jgi:glutamate--cysteine ligase